MEEEEITAVSRDVKTPGITGGSILIPDLPPWASREVRVGILVKSGGSPGGGMSGINIEPHNTLREKTE